MLLFYKYIRLYILKFLKFLVSYYFKISGFIYLLNKKILIKWKIQKEFLTKIFSSFAQK